MKNYTLIKNLFLRILKKYDSIILKLNNRFLIFILNILPFLFLGLSLGDNDFKELFKIGIFISILNNLYILKIKLNFLEDDNDKKRKKREDERKKRQKDYYQKINKNFYNGEIENMKSALEYIYNTNYEEILKKISNINSNEKLKQMIKRQYKKRAKEVHPDLGGDIQSFRLLNEKYEFLLNYFS